MQLMVQYDSVPAIAHALKETIDLTANHKYVLRPWNHFDLASSHWLIVPSTDWPAYQSGKGILKDSGLGTGELLCGLYIEKGFASKVQQVYPAAQKRGLILKPEWTWHRLFQSIRKNEIAQVAENIGQQTGKRVIVQISTEFVEDPSDFDPLSSTGGGRIWFEVRGNSLVKIHETNLLKEVTPLAKATCFQDLTQTLDGNRDLDWFWINFHIGSEIALTKEDSSTPRWNTGELWRNIILPWSKWMI